MRAIPYVALLLQANQALLVPPASLSRSSSSLRQDRRTSRLPAEINNQGDDDSQSLCSLPLTTTKSTFSSSTRPRELTNTGVQPVCRVVTRAGSKLPTNPTLLPPNLLQSPRLFNKLDDYYSASAHRATKKLDYLYREKGASLKRKEMDETMSDLYADPSEEQKLVGVVRNSLEDAGFELLNRRDIDLCDSLNAGYLLRLSIIPDVHELDGTIAKEFYPERFHANGTVINKDELLFDGRVLVYWRGYSEEVTQGRLLLPKLDYLQASVVQRSAASAKRHLDRAEKAVARTLLERARILRTTAKKSVDRIADYVAMDIASSLRGVIMEESEIEAAILPPKEGGRFKLGRYGGSKVRFVGSPDPTDALQPFLICEVPEMSSFSSDLEARNFTNVAVAERALKDEINCNLYSCEYDEKSSSSQIKGGRTRMELLERVSINNLVDFFSKSGRRKMIRAILEKSELVEPTYEEVVVIWRPKRREKSEFRPPKWLSDLADMFDIEGFEQPPENPKRKRRADIEIRNFEGVPMANLPAVLPKTRLIFRPADAFLFDMISFVTFLLVIGSIRLDSPRLDLLALVSVILWTLRTVFRYSNKLARYDLLVKTFLTSKISHRNAGALKYISSEAGVQRALRTALVYYWISNLVDAVKAPFSWRGGRHFKRRDLVERAQDDINNMLKTEKQVQMHVERSFEDLEKLRMIKFDTKDEDETLLEVLDPTSSFETIKESWVEFFEAEDENNDDTANGSKTEGPGEMTSPSTTDDLSSSQRAQNEGGRAFEILNENGLTLADFDERSKGLQRSLARSGQFPRHECVQGWQRGLTSNGLQPAYDGPSSTRSSSKNGQGEKRWYF